VSASLGKRYARALLALTRADGTVEAAGAELSRVAAALQEPRLAGVVLSPVIDSTARLRIVKEIVAALGVSRMVGNLVCLLTERNRLPILGDVARWYEELVDEELGRTRVQIRSAVPLSTAEKSELVELARRLTGRTLVVASTDVDPELLGGVTLDAGVRCTTAA